MEATNKMKRIFSLLVAVLMVAGMLVLVPSAEGDELPADATVLDYAGYIHDSYFVILAGDNMTVAELTALGHGEAKDMNYFAVAVVDGFDRILEINMTLGRPDGIKSDMVCPEYGYIIGLNGAKAGYEILASAQVGDTVELFNVDLDEIRGAEGHVALENAGFVIHSKSGDSDVWLNMPITEENGVAIDEGDVDGQLYVYPAGEEDRVLESSEGNLRYSYVVVCDKDGKPIEAGNNLVFASVDESFQNEITIPAGGFAFTFYYNSDNNGNQDLFDIYEDLTSMAPIYNQTIPVTNEDYTFAYADGWLEVYKAEEEAPESSQEESSEEPAESSEEEESSEEPAESSEEQQTSAPAPSTSAPAASSEAPVEDGAPIGIIVGVIVGVVVIAVVVVVIIRKRK